MAQGKMVDDGSASFTKYLRLDYIDFYSRNNIIRQMPGMKDAKYAKLNIGTKLRMQRVQ